MVLLLMVQVIAAKELTRYRLQQIVTAREDDLLRLAPPASIADLEKYGRDTAAQLLLLQVCIHMLLKMVDENLWRSAGKAYGHHCRCDSCRVRPEQLFLQHCNGFPSNAAEMSYSQKFVLPEKMQAQ